jgi:hypothetical protein
MEFIEYNTYKIITSKKLLLDKLLGKELKELHLMRHLYQNMNFKNGERNFGVSILD